MTSVQWWLRAGSGVLVRPSLWGVALVQLFRLARPGWWRRSPFLPVPEPEYLRFRLETQYGSDREPAPADVVTYLHWCRSFHQLT
ncbi:hypothetical protein [Aquihabitans sp. McL0605]|uniref:hypothetical protein n=1 Tax=Aquihabitans sp. McL0605 TaxID=3415671 RepID=UPI003CE8CE2E